MAGLSLVPIPIAVPLIVLTIALIPLTPVAWIWITLSGVSRGIREHEPPAQTAKAIGRWIGLSIALPWAAVIALGLMVVAQLLLAPLVLVHQLRALGETVTWLSAQLGIAPTATATNPPTNSTPVDVSSLLPYTFTPLPPTSSKSTPIRFLTIHPGPFPSPLRGTITTTTTTTTTTLPPSLTYDALSYTWGPPSPSPTPSRHATPKNDTLLILTPSTTSGTTYTTLPITPTCAAALRRLRLENKPRTVWVDAVCVNQDDPVEKSQLVGGGTVEMVFCGARRVVVYTGEGSRQTGRLFEWVNGLDVSSVPVGEEGLSVRAGGNLLGEGGRGGEDNGGSLGVWIGRAERMVMRMGWRGDIGNVVEVVWRAWNMRGRKVWEVVREQYRVEVLGLPPAVPVPPPDNLPEALAAYFSRRWFRRLWPLQEVMLPELSRVEFMCGDRTTTGERMLHLSTLLRQDQVSKGWDVERISRLARTPPQKTPTQSCLLDLLIETKDRQCEDPRDKIFALLPIARRLDGTAFMRRDSDISVDYRKSVAEVYASYSAQFIRRHGPAFFLALIKSTKIEGLPSWAADWTVPWPDERALAGIGSVSRYRAADEKDEVLDFETDTMGRMVMKIMRPRVVRGFFTRDGHVDGARRTQIESVRQLRWDEVLVEMYPGLALLLRQEKGQPEHYAFVRACPHALSREGVEKAVEGWSRVVVHKENVGQGHDGPPPKGYLSLPGVYKIV